MNRFILALYSRESALAMCDQHIRKMVTEEGQILSTCIRQVLPNIIKHEPKLSTALFRATHDEHPITVWTRSGQEPMRFAYSYFLAMANEHTYRFGTIHGSFARLFDPLRYVFNCNEFMNMASSKKKHPQCFGEYYEMCKTDEHLPVNAYRNYYNIKQTTFKRPMTYTNRSKPTWLKEVAHA